MSAPTAAATLSLVAVPVGEGAYAFLVHDKPVEEWAATLQKLARSRFHHVELPQDVLIYLSDPPRDYLRLLAFAYGRGAMKGLHGQGWEQRVIKILKPEIEVLHFEARECGPKQIARLVEETDERRPFGYALAAIRMHGERHGRDGFPPFYGS